MGGEGEGGQNLPRMFVNLAKLGLIFGNGHSRAIKDNKASTGGTLINSTDETFLQVLPVSVLVLQESAFTIIFLLGCCDHLELATVNLVEIICGLGVAIHTGLVKFEERVAHLFFCVVWVVVVVAAMVIVVMVVDEERGKRRVWG